MEKMSAHCMFHERKCFIFDTQQRLLLVTSAFWHLIKTSVRIEDKLSNQDAVQPKPVKKNFFKKCICLSLMKDVRLVQFDDKYFFIVLQITYFTGLP